MNKKLKGGKLIPNKTKFSEVKLLEHKRYITEQIQNCVNDLTRIERDLRIYEKTLKDVDFQIQNIISQIENYGKTKRLNNLERIDNNHFYNLLEKLEYFEKDKVSYKNNYKLIKDEKNKIIRLIQEYQEELQIFQNNNF